MKKSVFFIFILSSFFSLHAQETVLFSNVMRALNSGNFPVADSSLEILKTKHPKSRYIVDASLAIIDRNSDYFDSLVMLKNLLSSYPDYPEPDRIQYKLASLYYLHNNYTEAMKAFLTIGSNFVKSKFRPASYYWAGNIAFFRKEYAKAEYFFWETLKSKFHDSYQPMAALRLGDLSFEQKKYYSAITNYKRAVKDYVDSDVRLEACFYLAESYAHVRNYSEAERYYGIVIKEFPDSELAKFSIPRLKNVSKKKNPALQKDVRQTGYVPNKTSQSSYCVTVGSYDDARSANNLRLALKKDGFPVFYKVEKVKRKYVYMVRIGRYSDEDEAENVLSMIKEKYKIETAVVEELD